MESKDRAVQKWLSQLERSGHDASEIEEKVSLVEQFARFVGAAPSEIVDRCLSNGGVVIKERKKVEKSIEEFAGGDVAKANVIRSFMIHNGIRMIAPKPPWL